jgi:hypothetical protein
MGEQTTDKKTRGTMSAEEKARVIGWLRQSVAGEAVEPELREAAAELENPTWESGGEVEPNW